LREIQDIKFIEVQLFAVYFDNQSIVVSFDESDLTHLEYSGFDLKSTILEIVHRRFILQLIELGNTELKGICFSILVDFVVVSVSNNCMENHLIIHKQSQRSISSII